MQRKNLHLARLAIATLLIIGCIAVLLPFVGTLLFAIVICVTLWPLHRRLVVACRGKRTPAALIASLLLVLLILMPMLVLAGSLASSGDALLVTLRPYLEQGLPAEAPGWIAGLPWIGDFLAVYWHKVAASREELNSLLQMALAPTRKLLLATVALAGQGLLQVVLVIFFAFFLLRDGEAYAQALAVAARRLGGDLGERMLGLARGTVTGVMIGIVGTAAAQAVVGMIGYLIAGVPGVVVLTFATFIFSMVPVIGPTLIWGGAAVWLYQNGDTGWALFMLLWGVLAISSVDNFVKPVLISRTAALPLLLIIVGVFGGVLVFGFIGLFLGPTLLALGQALLRDWLYSPIVDTLPGENNEGLSS